jgi:RIO-like serine/threonine protein kinase
MDESLIVYTHSYAARRDLKIAERLGSGKDGIVFVAEGKITPGRVAIKVHRGEET